MKKLIFLLLIIVSLYSCSIDNKENVYPKFSITFVTDVPDSSINDYKHFITEQLLSVKADYKNEDYDDVVDNIYDAAKDIYSQSIECLLIEYRYENFSTIRIDRMNAEQKDIFLNLKNKFYNVKSAYNTTSIETGLKIYEQSLKIYKSKYKNDTINEKQLRKIQDSLIFNLK